MPKILDDEQIFLAVIKTIAERGYSGATTRQLAENAGISEVSLFRKYGNKKELIKQSLNFAVQHSELLESVQYTGHVRADLLRIASAYQKAIDTIGDFATAIVMEASRAPELQDLFDAPFQLFQKLGAIFSKYHEQGVLKKAYPLHSVVSFLSPIIFTSIIRNIRPELNLPKLSIDAHVDEFLEGRKVD